MQNDQYLPAFINYLKFEKRYSEHTVIAYKNDIQQFATFLEADFETSRWQEVTTVMLRSWMACLKNEEKSTHKTIHRKISSVKSFFKFLLRNGHVDTTPAEGIILPKLSKRLPEFVKETEMQNLLNTNYTLHTGDKQEPGEKTLWRNRTAELATQVFYETGIRLSELVNLQETQIDTSYGQLKVVGKGNKERIIPLSAKLLALLKDYMQDKPVAEQCATECFVNEKGKKLYPKFFYNAVKTQMTQGDIKLKKKSPHVLRHTFATHLMNEGADINAVKELLGHSSLAATQVYTHNTIEKLKEVYKKAHPKAK